MFRCTRRPGYGITDGKLRLLPAAEVGRVHVPGAKGPRKALRVGAGEATFLIDNERVRSCETWFANDTLVRSAPTFRLWNTLSKVVPGDTLDQVSDALVLKFKHNPPAEDLATNRYVVTAVGKGGGAEVRVTIDGTACYALTGFIAAAGAQALLEGKARHFGYQSLAQTLGARYVLGRLEEFHAQTTVQGARSGGVGAAQAVVAA
jgi:hypothetical protein